MNVPPILRWNSLSREDRTAALRRPAPLSEPSRMATVAEIFDRVRRDGDVALRELTRELDRVHSASFEVSEAEFAKAEITIEVELREALVEACGRLETWHAAGMPRDFDVETAPGVLCGRRNRGISCVGLYVPAGSAPLPSTVLMLGVPARLAGVREIVMCTPPRADGSADPVVLVAARLCGISRVFKLGGAQAVAAMALGSDSVPACDKLFGPGNAWVTAAKQHAAALPGGPAIDMPAGPSEVLVIADGGADARRLAADLLSQAEHGPDSQVLLVSNSPTLLKGVRWELAAQLPSLPRAAIAAKSLAFARLVLVDSMMQALALSNEYAPEHLLIAVREPELLLADVRRAGSVFLGDESAEALGDYCSGTNHVLPTGGSARAWSGLSVASFQTSISVQRVDFSGLAQIGPCAIRIARAEGLEAHARAVELRMETAHVRA